MAKLARFTIEPTPAKPTSSSKTVLVNLVVLLIAILPPVQEFLITLPGGEELAQWVVPALAGLNIVLRFLTSGPVAGVGAAAGYGLNYTGRKIGGGVKSVVNVLPGVNFK